MNSPVSGQRSPWQRLQRALRRIHRYYKVHIQKDEFTIEVTRWFADKGDQTLRLDYPSLTADSIVFDLGGYVGGFAADIHHKYGCKVYVFEPHPVYFAQLVERFRGNEMIILCNYGVSGVDGEFALSDSGDASSFAGTHPGDEQITCVTREFFDVVNELGIDHIDLMKINIEGGEYPLLEHISSKGMLGIADNYQIQFHDFIQGAKDRRDLITDALSETHHRTWCYTFVWENWEIK